MKTMQQATAGVLLGLLMTVHAVAQYAPQVIVPSSVQQTAYNADDYYPVSQGNACPAPEKAAPAAEACYAGCDSCGGSEAPPCRWCLQGKLADPWTLPQPESLKDRNITIGGWLSGGIYGNQYGARNNGPVGLRRRRRRIYGRPTLDLRRAEDRHQGLRLGHRRPDRLPVRRRRPRHAVLRRPFVGLRLVFVQQQGLRIRDSADLRGSSL